TRPAHRRPRARRVDRGARAARRVQPRRAQMSSRGYAPGSARRLPSTEIRRAPQSGRLRPTPNLQTARVPPADDRTDVRGTRTRGRAAPPHLPDARTAVAAFANRDAFDDKRRCRTAAGEWDGRTVTARARRDRPPPG